MPCRSDYMEARGDEVQFSRVACLLDELDGKPINESHWRGYHPKVYSKHLTKKQEDEMVAELCSKLQKVDVTKYSLEMQIWWRDHQKADKERIKQEKFEANKKRLQQQALSKLTDEEKEALDL